MNADLLSGASAYLGVTVGADAEMSPRQPLSMSPYAYTALQLVSDQDIRINSGISYSTFTTKGNLTLQYGVVGTTATFANITSTGVGTFSIVTSSGINLQAGTLDLTGTRGINGAGTGIVMTTATFANIVSSGVGTFSIVTSSGIDVNAGTLSLVGSRGIDATGTGVVATTGTFMTVTSTNVGTFSITSSSGINMGAGTLKLDSDSRGIDATGTGIFASSGIFNTVTLTTPTAALSITVTNTLIDVTNISFLKLTSNNATSTNRIFCLTAGRPGQLLVLKWDTNSGTNEGQLSDGLSNAGSCTSANGAQPAALSAVWPATTNQTDDAILLIWGGSEWTEIGRSAN